MRCFWRAPTRARVSQAPGLFRKPVRQGPPATLTATLPGHSCIALAGPSERVITLETGKTDRVENMHGFARAALELLLAEIGGT